MQTIRLQCNRKNVYRQGDQIVTELNFAVHTPDGTALNEGIQNGSASFSFVGPKEVTDIALDAFVKLPFALDEDQNAPAKPEAAK